MASDEGIVERIDRLIDEEQRLRAHGDGADHERIEAIEVELDQCWDLLRQRRARAEFGSDPNQARARDADVVEGYQQ